MTTISNLVVTPQANTVQVSCIASAAVCGRLLIGPSSGSYTTCTTGYSSVVPDTRFVQVGYNLLPSTLYHWIIQWYDRNHTPLDATTDATFTTTAAPVAAPPANFVVNNPMTFAPDNTYAIGASGATRPSSIYAAAGVYLGNTTTTQGGALYGGSGVPAAGLGANGDVYFRVDGGAGTTIYQKRAGAWVATAV